MARHLLLLLHEGRSALTLAVNARSPCSLVPGGGSVVKALKDGVVLLLELPE